MENINEPIGVVATSSNARSQKAAQRREAKEQLLQYMRNEPGMFDPRILELLHIAFPIKTPAQKQRIGGPNNILRLFGEPPVIGGTISALDVFQVTGFGHREMAKQCKAARNRANPADNCWISFNPLTQIYTLMSIGDHPEGWTD